MIFEKKRRNIFVAQGIDLVGFVGFCWVFGTIYIFLTHPCRRQPLCIKMVYNICWRSFLRGHDPVTITF